MVGKYKVITLCGSTRFKDAFMEAQKRLTLEGNIVISVGLFGHSGDDEVWTEGTKEIFDKINNSDLFVADVSLCFTNNEKEKKSPNPNVLIELGYAIRVLGWERIICVFNLAYGTPEELPFDIQHHSLLSYSFEGKSNNEVKLIVAESIFKDIRDLRNKAPLIKEGVPLHIVGNYDPNRNQVTQYLLPVDLWSRVDSTKISELKNSAKKLYDAIVNLGTVA